MRSWHRLHLVEKWFLGTAVVGFVLAAAIPWVSRPLVHLFSGLVAGILLGIVLRILDRPMYVEERSLPADDD